MVHEGWVHRPQFVGVMALGIVGVFCVVGIFFIARHASKGSEIATAVSVLGSIASAAVGGIAGMLTGRSGADAAAAVRPGRLWRQTDKQTSRRGTASRPRRANEIRGTMSGFEQLASYRRCNERICSSWRSFQDAPAGGAARA